MGIVTKTLRVVIQETSREKLETISTQRVSSITGIPIPETYALLDKLAKLGWITKIDAIRGDSFLCCDWMRISD